MFPATKTVLCATILTLIAACGAPAVVVPGPAQAAPQRSPRWSDEGLARMNLAVEWDLETSRNDFVGMTLQEDTLYAITADHTLYSIDIDGGTVNWVYSVGEPLTYPPVVYRYKKDEESGIVKYDEVLLLSGDRIRVVDKDLGELLWTKEVAFPAASPPAGTAGHVLLGSWDDRVYAIMKDAPHGRDWKWLTHGDVVAAGVEYDPLYISVSSDGGIYAFSEVGGELRWKKDTRGPIVTRPVAHQGKLYVGSMDFSLYCIDLLESEVDWRLEMAGPITKPAVVIGDSVYVISRDRVLTAVRRVAGRPKPGEKRPAAGDVLWRVKVGRKDFDMPSGARVLCRGRETLYVLNERREVMGIDQETGNVKWRVPFGRINFFATNLNDPASRSEVEAGRAGTIFLGTKDGWFFALKEKREF